MALLARRGFRYDVCRRTAAQAWEFLQETETDGENSL
jgi:hypothetical protein